MIKRSNKCTKPFDKMRITTSLKSNFNIRIKECKYEEGR